MSEIKSGFRFSFIAAVMPLAALVLLAGLAQSEQWFWIFLAVMSHFILLLLISLPQKHAVSYYLNAKGGFWIAVGGTIALGALADIYQNMFLMMALLYCTWFFVVWLLFLPSQLSHWFACIAVFGFICSVFASHTPSKIAFELARPTLERKIQQLESGDTVDVPFRTSCFRMYAIQHSKRGLNKSNGNQYVFWYSKFGHNRTGLVWNEFGDVENINIWAMIELDKNWTLVAED